MSNRLEGAIAQDELTTCVSVLRRLRNTPLSMLDKRASDFKQLAEVRAEANRLIESIKTEVRRARGQVPDAKARAAALPPVNEGSPNRPSERPSQSTHSVRGDASRRCYVCGRRGQRHASYAQMCQACGEISLLKRSRSVDLSGRRAVVTGGRVRIGYHVSLKLLRAGAEVAATTRFPRDAAQRYAQEPDFDDWRVRLTLHGLDMRDGSAVARFAEEVAHHPLDVLVNNAAQTVRRPPAFYQHLIQGERATAQMSSAAARLVHSRSYHQPDVAPQIRSNLDHAESQALALRPAVLAAELANLKLIPSDDAAAEHSLAPGDEDQWNEPVDLRPVTSWTQRIGDVHPIEFLEVCLVNAFAPFQLLQRLLPPLRRSPHERRFVVNVTAREGQFSVAKDSQHPHTNMAKAALNMLTRSTAGDLAKEGIYVNSVDPGWVTHQQPKNRPGVKEAAPNPTPLDAEDGAARVLDPIFQGVAEKDEPPFGRLFKNFAPEEW